MKIKTLKNFVLIFLFFGIFASAQKKQEREYRIRKSQFPEEALHYIKAKLVNAKRIRFYKETDSTKVSYTTKFKKARLWYGIAFDVDGTLENVEIRIKPIDIPDATFQKINSYLEQRFLKYKLRKIRQQYPVTDGEEIEVTVKNAFQNLMLPSINYELLVAGKKGKNYEQHDILFDAEGNFKMTKKSLPANYDRVLY